jgi:hypothetical protein
MLICTPPLCFMLSAALVFSLSWTSKIDHPFGVASRAASKAHAAGTNLRQVSNPATTTIQPSHLSDGGNMSARNENSTSMSQVIMPDSSRSPNGANARTPNGLSARQRGDHVVNVSTLWPERTAAKSQQAAALSTDPISPLAPPSRNYAARPHSAGLSGAEQIMEANVGDIGDGQVVEEDGNVHRSALSKRSVTLLPAACEGALGLKIPELIKGHVANVTLPSRLALLGRQSYETIAALRPINLGNSVLGFAPVLNKGRSRVGTDLYVLPWIYSKGGARIWIFLRILLFLVFLVFFFQFAQVWDLNIGRAWFFGSSIAIYIMYRLALIRRAPDGVMAFCRSMGAPEIEEYMFSYSWKVEPDAVRTLAKAMWNNGVGVWIDVVKLCPGDEIRPMVRTMVNRVHRTVVFLSPAYISSPNCCVEFHEAVQWPKKLLICIMQPVPQLAEFISQLESQGAVVVTGLRALIAQLDDEICDVNDSSAWRWWRKQKISGGGVPSHTVATSWHTIPKWTVTGRIQMDPRALTAGPVYLSGDCSSAGQRFFPPYLFLLAVAAVVANFVDLYFTFRNTDCTYGVLTKNDGEQLLVHENPTSCHNTIDYIWLGMLVPCNHTHANQTCTVSNLIRLLCCAFSSSPSMAICNLAPFTAWPSLFETRTDVHPVMRPLLASKSMNGGVKITIVGHDTDPIVANLNKFLTIIDHNAKKQKNTQNGLTGGQAEAAERDRLKSLRKLNDSMAADDAPKQKEVSLAAGFSQSITIYVMNDFAQRDALFGKDDFPFDPRTSLFVWSATGDPFTKDEIGERLMRFLVLVAAWDRNLLAENLFSAIGVRVVDMLRQCPITSGDAVGFASSLVTHLLLSAVFVLPHRLCRSRRRGGCRPPPNRHDGWRPCCLAGLI